ncbi:MAG: 1,4-dihydroxy-2-naphthoate prenyltransferase [Bacillales bacterium]|jgi:1,4-dihydroxy-2-naphthoate octaprenyltransferase|nr:1,4-dihydroxy-2-naphthoate prenyltransferase [Bacillales bacterium]
MQTQINSNVQTNSPNQSNFSVWWHLLRPHTLTASFVPVFIGTASAIKYLDTLDIRYSLFFAMLIACMLIQAATNMFNEYYDYKRGLDNAESIGIGGAIVRHGVKPKTVKYLALIFYAIAFLLGIYISAETSWTLLALGLVSMAAGYFYTGGPIPIAYTPFGEIVAAIFMGVFIICTSFYIQAGLVTTESVMHSLPTSILIALILTANNIRDLDNDKVCGRKTLAILLGKKNSIIFLGIMFLISFLLVIYMTLTTPHAWFYLLVLLSIPKAIKATKGFIGKTKPIEMMPAMVATAQVNTMFGFLFGIGILLTYFF